MKNFPVDLELWGWLRFLLFLAFQSSEDHQLVTNGFGLMNFYFEAVNILDRIDAKKGSIKGILAGVNEKDRKRMSAAVIHTLEC